MSSCAERTRLDASSLRSNNAFLTKILGWSHGRQKAVEKWASQGIQTILCSHYAVLCWQCNKQPYTKLQCWLQMCRSWAMNADLCLMPAITLHGDEAPTDWESCWWLEGGKMSGCFDTSLSWLLCKLNTVPTLHLLFPSLASSPWDNVQNIATCVHQKLGSLA